LGQSVDFHVHAAQELGALVGIGKRPRLERLHKRFQRRHRRSEFV
jgi:hypothetical protein